MGLCEEKINSIKKVKKVKKTNEKVFVSVKY